MSEEAKRGKPYKESPIAGMSQDAFNAYMKIAEASEIPLETVYEIRDLFKNEAQERPSAETTATEPVKPHPHQVGNSASCHPYRVPVQMQGESVKDFFERCCKETESQRHADFIRSHPPIFYPNKCQQPGPTVTYVDAETTKIRKHTHDTLWSILAGVAAAAGLMVVMAAIVLAILSFARGL